jgi:predicted acyl esterase
MQYPLYDQVETDYPVPRTSYTKLYLTSQKTLQPSPSTDDAVHSYDSTTGDILAYDYVFTEQTTLAGLSKLKIFMSCLEHNDLDIYVMLRKVSLDGVLMEQSNVPLHELSVKSVKEVANVNPTKYLGPTGMLRASHRELDSEKSTEYWPVHPHLRADYVTPGKVVELDIGIWPMGIIYEKGEGLRLQISGKTMVLPEWDNPHVKHAEPQFNKGRHRVHLGGEFAGSFLLVPQL